MFSGFDKIEVTALLMAAADDYEQALRETDRLRQDLTKLDVVLAEYREHEKILNTTLMAAQKLADDITSNAEEESRRIIREAQGRSDLLLDKTQARLEDIQREVDGLKLKRRDVETSIEATIQTLRNTLEFVREQDVRDREDRLLLYRPRGDAESERAPARDSRQRGDRRWPASARVSSGPSRGRRSGTRVIDDSPAGATIEVRVIPRARKTELAGSRQGALLVRLAAPPVDGAANDALISFLAERLRCRGRADRGGERSRQKRIWSRTARR